MQSAVCRRDYTGVGLHTTLLDPDPSTIFQILIYYSYSSGDTDVTPNQPLTMVLFTFLGEKLSAVLPGSDHFAWNLPKELHDQSDVVCQSPHTPQREQARFSITACTHINTAGCTRLKHTAASWLCMDTSTD